MPSEGGKEWKRTKCEYVNGKSIKVSLRNWVQSLTHHSTRLACCLARSREPVPLHLALEYVPATRWKQDKCLLFSQNAPHFTHCVDAGYSKSVDGGYKRQMEKCQFGSVELPDRDKTMYELQLRLYLVFDRQMKGCNINIHPLTRIF